MSDVVRQKKKYPKKPKLESVISPQQSTTEPLPVISKSDIKQYDFHSSDEDEFPQVIHVSHIIKQIFFICKWKNPDLYLDRNGGGVRGKQYEFDFLKYKIF